MKNTENVMEKAAAILRARLPKLSASALNFEKRTGNFFKATTEVADDGTEKVRRLVVADDTIPADCSEEVRAKRAAATVAGFEAAIEKADKAIAEAADALAAANTYKDELIAANAEAVAVVEGFELPEKAERQTLAKTVQSQADEIARLRAALAAAGIEL